MSNNLTQEENLVKKFLEKNRIVCRKIPQKGYPDFYLPEFNFLIELKSPEETGLAKILRKHRVKGITSIPLNDDWDSYNTIKEHLIKAVKQRRTAKDNCQFKQAVFFVLFMFKRSSQGLSLEQFLNALQFTNYMPYSLKAFKGKFLNKNKKQYYLSNQEIKKNTGRLDIDVIDYLGIIRKNNEWRIELIERPHYKGKGLRNQRNKFTKLLDIYTPTFLN